MKACTTLIFNFTEIKSIQNNYGFYKKGAAAKYKPYPVFYFAAALSIFWLNYNADYTTVAVINNLLHGFLEF